MTAEFASYECRFCGFIYHEADGLPDDGIPPGTKWSELSEEWFCPQCGVAQCDFDKIEA